jgi:hypothetical protein
MSRTVHARDPSRVTRLTRMSQEQWGPTHFTIGHPWPWEPEWVETRGFRWLPDSMVLLMVEDDVTQQMRDAMAGPADLALLAHGPLVGLLVRFGDVWGWAESLAWSRPGQPIPDPLIDTGEATPHAVFHVVLVNRNTKLVEHMRLFTASAYFTKALYREVQDRWQDGTTIEAAQAAFATFEAKYPTMDSAVHGAWARCHGGD